MLWDKFRTPENIPTKWEKIKTWKSSFRKGCAVLVQNSGLLFFCTSLRSRIHPNHVQRKQLLEISVTTFHRSSRILKHVGLFVQQPRGKERPAQADAALCRIPRTIIWSTNLNTLKTISLDRRWSAWDSNREAPRSTTDAELSPTTFLPNLITVLVGWSV